jgi:hypothetical protein
VRSCADVLRHAAMVVWWQALSASCGSTDEAAPVDRFLDGKATRGIPPVNPDPGTRVQIQSVRASEALFVWEGLNFTSPKESSMHEGLNKIYLQNLSTDECNFCVKNLTSLIKS